MASSRNPVGPLSTWASRGDAGAGWGDSSQGVALGSGEVGVNGTRLGQA